MPEAGERSNLTAHAHDNITDAGTNGHGHADTNAGNRDKEVLTTLRTDPEFHGHHVRGDVGGEYHPSSQHREGGSEKDEGGTGSVKVDVNVNANTDVGEGGHRKQPILVVVMGVSGSGKSTLGSSLANTLHLPFIDADALHPEMNIEKMARGEALTDEDRAPWLERVRREAVGVCLKQEQENEEGEENGTVRRRGIVVGCSALKRAYRDVLRGEVRPSSNSSSPSSSSFPSSSPHKLNPPLRTYFVYIYGIRSVLLKRMEHRKGHFMKASMLDGQLQTLEPPDQSSDGTREPGVVVVDLEDGTEVQVEKAVRGLREVGADV